MRLLFWYCDKFAWTPAMKTLDSAPEAMPGNYQEVLVAGCCVVIQKKIPFCKT